MISRPTSELRGAIHDHLIGNQLFYIISREKKQIKSEDQLQVFHFKLGNYDQSAN